MEKAAAVPKKDKNRWDFPSFYRLVPEQYLKARLIKVAGLCRELDLAGVLLTQAVDVYYLSGTMQQGALLVAAQGEPRLYLRRHAGRGDAESPWPVRPVKGFTQVAQEVSRLLPAGSRLGMPFDNITAGEYLGWQKRLPQLLLADMAGPWQEIKAVKDQFELEALQRAGQLAVECYAELPRILKPGLTEAAAAGQFLAISMAKGSINAVRTRSAYADNYTWHLVAGPEANRPSSVDAPFSGFGPSPAFPMGASPRPMGLHEPIIVDMSICADGYVTDQTRTYCLGSIPEELHRAHECLESMEQTILENLRPGVISGEIFDLAVNVAHEHSMEDYFLGPADHRARYIAHGVGLELGAAPYLLQGSKALVKAGHCYALELKIVMDAGPVGLENSVTVNQNGPPTILTPIPNRLFELPA